MKIFFLPGYCAAWRISFYASQRAGLRPEVTEGADDHPDQQTAADGYALSCPLAMLPARHLSARRERDSRVMIHNA
jgi:hypothetical protein